jgi:hypothetical protein
MLIKLLIVFFTCLIGYQLFLALFNSASMTQVIDFMGGKGSGNRWFPDLIEGLENSSTEYKDYNTDDPNNPNSSLILSQQNAGNIEVLKGRVDGLDGVKNRVDTLQQSVDSMQTQIDALVQQQADYATDLAGDTPAEVTGLEEATAEDEEEEI